MAGSIHHRRIESYPRMCLLIPLTPKKEKEERRKALVFLNLEKSTQVRTHTNLTNPSLAYDDSKQSLATIFAHCPPVSQGPRHFVLGRSRPRPPIAQASQRKRRKRTSSSHTLHSCTPRLFLSCFFFSFFFVTSIHSVPLYSVRLFPVFVFQQHISQFVQGRLTRIHLGFQVAYHDPPIGPHMTSMFLFLFCF